MFNYFIVDIRTKIEVSMTELAHMFASQYGSGVIHKSEPGLNDRIQRSSLPHRRHVRWNVERVGHIALEPQHQS